MDCDKIELQALVYAIGAITKLNVSNVKPKLVFLLYAIHVIFFFEQDRSNIF